MSQLRPMRFDFLAPQSRVHPWTLPASARCAGAVHPESVEGLSANGLGTVDAKQAPYDSGNFDMT
ncbi:MAG TPA: hypothetical protein VFL78_12250, partial [Rhodanobacteraceae bacterium]|nr:hypothetical protein [Rhodanobacteraceae bacterium]